MKSWAVFIALLSLCATAAAKPDPVGPDELTPSLAEAAVIEPQSVALAREANYIRAPQVQPAKDKNFSCRRELLFSAKPIRLARSCP